MGKSKMKTKVKTNHPPTPLKPAAKPSHLWTGTGTDFGTALEKWAAAHMETIALLCLIAYLVVGIIIGIIIIGALPFEAQVIAMVSYIVLGLLGWLPWQLRE